MFNSDRGTRMLLGFIALCLGFLVCKSLFQGAPHAVAQSEQPGSVVQNTNVAVHNGDNGVVYNYRTTPVSTINIAAKDKVVSLQVIDSAQAFLVQFSNRIEVYRVDAVNMTDLAAARQQARQ